MAINPPDLAFGIRQIATGITVNDGQGDPVRAAFEKINFDLTIISAQLTSLGTETDTLDTQIQNILATIAQIQSDLTDVENQQVINTGNIATLLADVLQLQIDLSLLTARVTNLELNLGSLQGTVSTLGQDLDALTILVDTKAPIDSPTFTGSPTLAPTSVPPSLDDSTRIATTSWVVQYTASLSGDGFAPGTGMLFYQAAPPTDWIFANAVDDLALRIDNDNAGQKVDTGNGFLTALRSNVSTAQKAVTINNATGLNSGNASLTVNASATLTTSAHVLSVAQMPAHTHGIRRANGDDSFSADFMDIGEGDEFSGTVQSQSAGGNAGHSHTVAPHTHTGSVHSHSFPSHGHSSPVHDHTLNLDIKYANVMLCIKQ